MEDAWCRASYRWFAQLLLRFGKIDFKHPMFKSLLGSANYKSNQPPPCYDVTKLTMLSLADVVWFDEMHKKCTIGESGSRVGPGKPNVTISFKRDESGKLDLKNGSYNEEQKTILQVKYEHEARFCFGVYMSDDEEGHKVSPFHYTGRRLITRIERPKVRLQHIAYVRSNKGK